METIRLAFEILLPMRGECANAQMHEKVQSLPRWDKLCTFAAVFFIIPVRWWRRRGIYNINDMGPPVVRPVDLAALVFISRKSTIHKYEDFAGVHMSRVMVCC